MRPSGISILYCAVIHRTRSGIDDDEVSVRFLLPHICGGNDNLTRTGRNVTNPDIRLRIYLYRVIVVVGVSG